MKLEHAIRQIREEAARDLQESIQAKEIESLRVKYFGKKGRLQELMEALRDCPPAEKPIAGKSINDLKAELSVRFAELQEVVDNRELHERLERERLDITLPGRISWLGRKHVVTRAMDEALEILTEMSFSVQYGPEMETDYYNFEALNFPKDHPARDMQDTFYITGDLVMRTHTSNTQVRVMEASAPPIRIAAPGRCFRNEDISPRSHVMFHQIEGLYIDRDVTFADLFVTLGEFYKRFFGKQLEIRFRPSYFPFVEPGMEVDIECLSCDGAGCHVCKQTGWLEVAGAGMVHPEVMKFGGIDPEEYSGYAWGGGVERLAMLRYGITDIRLFYENNLNFLSQY